MMRPSSRPLRRLNCRLPQKGRCLMIPRETLAKAAEALRREFRTLSAAYLIEDAAAENDDKPRDLTPWAVLAQAAITEQFHEFALEWRGIEPEDACNECSGAGVISYSNTATWHSGIGGISGQAITQDVCDKCWGSGSKSKPWPSWRSR
jgi:hypothetical protein